MLRLLVIEGQTSLRDLIEERLDDLLDGSIIDSEHSVQAGVASHSRNPFHLVIWDSQSAPLRCSNLSRTINKFSRAGLDTKMIFISELPEPEIIGTVKLDCDWLTQPVRQEEILASVEAALAAKGSAKIGEGSIDVPAEFEGMIALTLTMRSVIQQVVEAAATDIPVLVTGETGTGKDLVAAAIHKRSARKNAPYVAVNMGAITSELAASELFGHEKGAYTGASDSRPGFFEQAQHGTIFLDEITTMDEKTQVSLLRVLEHKAVRRVRGDKDIQVDVRVIAATNENIENAVKAGRFREDLYYRLDVFRIHLPPLRERHGAISLLTDDFVARYSEAYNKTVRSVSRETYRLLRRYAWPGNIRELKNVIQRAVLTAKSPELTPDVLPHRIQESLGSENRRPKDNSPIRLGMRLGDVEKEYIKLTLSSINGNKMQAASLLGISRRALYNKLKRFNLE